jgi:hypothetical protein
MELLLLSADDPFPAAPEGMDNEPPFPDDVEGSCDDKEPLLAFIIVVTGRRRSCPGRKIDARMQAETETVS